MKGKGKGRPCSFSPTGSPNQNSKGDGKGGDDGSAEGTPKFTGEIPSGKANRQSFANFKRGKLPIIGIFPNVQNAELQVGCNFGDKCAYKHAAKPANANNSQHRLLFTFH